MLGFSWSFPHSFEAAAAAAIEMLRNLHPPAALHPTTAPQKTARTQCIYYYLNTHPMRPIRNA